MTGKFEGPNHPKPTREDLWEEVETGLIKLASIDDMQTTLGALVRTDNAITDPVKLQEIFFGKLYKYADKEMLPSGVPAVIVEAIDEYLKVGNVVDRKFLEAHVPELIDAMILEEAARQKAKDFYRNSIATAHDS